MQNGTLEAPTPERTLELDDEMRKVLAAEAKWFCASIGDQIEHAPAGKHGRGTVVLRREAERISLAIALCAAVENGALNAPDLPQIVEMVSDTVREYRDELHHYGEGCSSSSSAERTPGTSGTWSTATGRGTSGSITSRSRK
jgi:hypothetical protein